MKINNAGLGLKHSPLKGGGQGKVQEEYYLQICTFAIVVHSQISDPLGNILYRPSVCLLYLHMLWRYHNSDISIACARAQCDRGQLAPGAQLKTSYDLTSLLSDAAFSNLKFNPT